MERDAFPFRSLTLLARHPACKKLDVGGDDLTSYQFPKAPRLTLGWPSLTYLWRYRVRNLLLSAVPVEQIYTAKPFKSAPAKGMSWSTRPAIIKQVYGIAEPPPALQKLNCFRSVA